MLKVYSVLDYVSIDGADWRMVGDWGYIVTDEEPKNKLILDNISFSEAYEYLSDHFLNGVRNETSLIFNKPLVCINYNTGWGEAEYRRFSKISYKREFEEWANVSLQWIMKNLPADQCIQYLKERGMNTCPLNTTK